MLNRHGRQQRAGSTQGRRPGVSNLHAPHRGRRTAHVYKGCLGTWEICELPVKAGTWKRSEKPSDQGARRSRSAAVGARKSGNQSEGPGGAKGGTGVGNRRRERWKRL